MLEVVSIHIGKTAGTAFRHVLLQVFGQENLFLDYAPYTYEPSEPLPEHIRAIHGHVAVEKYLNYFADANWIVWLRHPVFRLISEYFFAQVYKDVYNPLHVELIEKKLGLLEFAEHPDARNIQSQQIQGKSLSEFCFVGLQEFYQEDVADLRNQLKWPEIEMSTENLNPHPTYAQDLQAILSEPSIIQQLALWNREDMELYQTALSLRAARRQESLGLQYTLMGLRQSQPLLHQLQTKLHQLEIQLRDPEQPPLSLQICRSEHTLLETLLGFSIDAPVAGDLLHEAITVEGWVLGQQARAVALKILARGRVLAESPVNQQRPDVAEVYQVPEAMNSGFSTRVFVTGMQAGAELSLQVVLADQNTVEIGTIQLIPSEEVHKTT